MLNPVFTVDYASALLHQHYGSNDPEVTRLDGEQDATFNVKTLKGDLYCLKITDVSADLVDLQLSMMKHLAQDQLPFSTPEPLPNNNGALMCVLPEGGIAYLTTWLEGTIYAKAKLKDGRLRERLGSALGKLSQSLEGFDHQAAHREIRWDNSRLPWIHSYLDIFSPEQRAIVDQGIELFERHAAPVLSGLRSGVNFNDANDYNLMTQRDQDGHFLLTGVFDFGDAVYTAVINELAVALAYAIMEQPDPINAAKEVIGNYHEAFPLQAEEVAALPALIWARLMTSVTVSTINQQSSPERAY